MEQDITIRWQRLEAFLKENFGKDMTMESIMFLIGVRELGSTPQEFSKEEKVDLMHIAICKLLSQSGYYKLSYLDQDGWPHWELTRPLPYTDIFSQLHLLRSHVLDYFEAEGIYTA
ncbi:MAG: hypothetical protein AAF824_02500 [Bacteroidota bacterium]